MAIALVALSIALRYIAPHYFLAELESVPLVPVATALMILAVGISILRKKIQLGIPSQAYVLGLLFLWAIVSLAVNAGLGEAAGIFTTDFLRDFVFVVTVMVCVDNLKRWKIFIGAVMVSMLVVGIFGLPQTFGPYQCAEWAEGDMANLKFDGRSCSDVRQCFDNQPKERLIPGIGPRLYRCERRGWFGVAAYLGRVHWIGVFDDSNNLAGTVGPLICLLMGIFWASTRKLHRVVWPLLAFFYAAVVYATGSRGGQLALVVGAGLTLWALWGKKAVILGLAAATALGVLVLTGHMVKVRDEQKFEGDTRVSDEFRREAMEVGFRLWSHYPIFGVGHSRIDRYHVIDPHNAFLCAAAELGTPGLLLFTLGLWANFKGAFRLRRRAREAGNAKYYQLATGLLGANVTSTISLTFFLSTYDRLSWMVPMIYSTGLMRAAKEELPEFELRLDYKDLLLLVPATFAVLGLFYVGLMASFTMS
ncbi:MAG: O-antigen ligase family protein [Deltaproteobacteria bacterium]|nr:O-antigen ligase family protein [Deltaproteobacteria bacterium]